MAKAAKPIRVSRRAQARAHPAIKAVRFEPAAANPADGPTLGRTTLTHAQIEADPNNPRKVFGAEAVDELAASIAQDGLLQNLLVRPAQTLFSGAPAYRLVAGERRWRAIGAAIAKGLVPADFAIPVDVRQLSDEQAAFLALLENMARKDLKPLEEARHFRLLIDAHGQTTATIAEKTGFTQRFVQQRLQLLELKPADLKQLEIGAINIEQARTKLANYPKPLELPPSVWLAVVEVYDVAAKLKTAGQDDKVWIAPGFSFDAELQGVTGYPHYLLQSVNTDYVSMIDTGRRFTRPSYDVAAKVLTRFGIELGKVEARTALIRDLAEKVMGLIPYLNAVDEKGPDAPLTPWILTEAPNLSAEVFDAICESKAETERRQAAQAETDKQRSAALGEALNLTTSIEARVRQEPPKEIDDRYAAALKGAGCQLPLYCDDKGEVTDAEGRSVVRGGWGHPHEQPMITRHKLLAIAVNAAAGLATPEKPHRKLDPDAPDRDTFIASVEEALADEGFEPALATARANAALDAFLEAEGIEYADDEYDWEETRAMSLVHGILEDGLGAHPVEATETPAEPSEDADPELTPALMKLAGVKTKATAETVEA